MHSTAIKHQLNVLQLNYNQTLIKDFPPFLPSAVSNGNIHPERTGNTCRRFFKLHFSGKEL